MSMIIKKTNLPSPSEVLAREEFVERTGVSPEHLEEILALDWINTRTSAASAIMFSHRDIYRVRKLERICGDFELPVIGGTIIVDLLERIERLEQMVRKLDKLGGN